MVGVPVDAADFDPAKVPDHLKITFRVVDERRRKLAEDKDLEALQLRLKPKTRAAISKAFEQAAERPAGDRKGGGASGPAPAGPEQRTGLTSWTIGTLPRTFETRRARPAAEGVPGAGRRGQRRGRTALRHRGRAAAGDVARAPAG